MTPITRRFSLANQANTTPVSSKKCRWQASCGSTAPRQPKTVYQARFAYIHQRFELLTSVRQQFYRVLAQERRVAVLRQLVEIATRSHSAAQQREKAGAVAETDVLLLLVELQQAPSPWRMRKLILAGARDGRWPPRWACRGWKFRTRR